MKHNTNYKKNIKKGFLLAWFTILYNFLEGIISIWFGIEDEALALIGFGGDSLIEIGSAIFVLRRLITGLKQNTDTIRDIERKSTFGIGLLFLLLATGTTVVSIFYLVNGFHPETTMPGAIISGISISFMFFLWRSKLKVATALNSMTLKKDASCSLACIKLSLILFCGSMLFLIEESLWWVDSVSALFLCYFFVKEGLESIRSSRKSDFTGGCC